MKKRIAVYPGTFDPITWGHLDVIQAASAIFDELVVGLLVNPKKKPMFSEEERLAMIEGVLAEFSLENVRAVVFKGLTVEFAQQEKAVAIVRGLRLVMDYEAELDISFNNRVLDSELYTVFMAPSQEHIHIRSSTVRELLAFEIKEKIRLYVPPGARRHIFKGAEEA